jgi:hypothetical protein
MDDFQDRYSRMARLNTRPAPPVELDSYYARHDDDYMLCRGGNAISSMFLIIIGMVMGMVVISVARSCDRAAEPVAVNISCTGCHSPNLKTYKAYRKYHQQIARQQ